MVTYYQSKDMTEKLNADGYWASYNNVYFDEFRKISGEEAMVQEKGPQLYSWANSSRAKIFERDHNNVVDLDTMIHMMRFIQIISISFKGVFIRLILDTITLHMMNSPNVIVTHRIQRN